MNALTVNRQPEKAASNFINRTALLVVGPKAYQAKPELEDGDLRPADKEIKKRLTLLGYGVCCVPDATAKTTQADGKLLVFISATADHKDLKHQFRDVETPVIVAQSFLYPAMGMTGPKEGMDFGLVQVEGAEQSDAEPKQSVLQLFPGDELRDHPMMAGLWNRVRFCEGGCYASFGNPSRNAVRIAYCNDDENLVVLFGYEGGRLMHRINAPARRVGLFLGAETAGHLTALGWRLFDEAVSWAAGEKAKSFDRVFRRECQEITERRVKQRYVKEAGSHFAQISDSASEPSEPCPPDDLVGLALSGGGIRSATFNLGLLQGLHEHGWLRLLDYLSTVSGGGFIGAWWSAWLSREDHDRQNSTDEHGMPAFALAPRSVPEKARDAAGFIRRLLPLAQRNHNGKQPQVVRHPSHKEKRAPLLRPPHKEDPAPLSPQLGQRELRDPLSRELWEYLADAPASSENGDPSSSHPNGSSESSGLSDLQFVLSELFRSELKEKQLKNALYNGEVNKALRRVFSDTFAPAMPDLAPQGSNGDKRDEVLKEYIAKKIENEPDEILNELAQMAIERLNQRLNERFLKGGNLLCDMQSVRGCDYLLTSPTLRLSQEDRTQEAWAKERGPLLNRLLLEEAYPNELGRGIFPPTEKIEPQRDLQQQRERLNQGSANEEMAKDLLSAGNDPVHHLRLFANYLTPRRGALSQDTWRAVSTFVRNLALTWAALLPILFVAVLLGQIYFIVGPKEVSGIFDTPQWDWQTLNGAVLIWAFHPLRLLLVWILVLTIFWLLLPGGQSNNPSKGLPGFILRNVTKRIWWTSVLRTVTTFVLVVVLATSIFEPAKLKPLLVQILGLALITAGWTMMIWHSPSLRGSLLRWKFAVLHNRITQLHSNLMVAMVVLALLLAVAVGGPALVDFLVYHSRYDPRARVVGAVMVIAALAGALFTAIKSSPAGGGDTQRGYMPTIRSRFILSISPPLVLFVLAVGFSWLARNLIGAISHDQGMHSGLTLATYLGIGFSFFLVLTEMRLKGTWPLRTLLIFWALLVIPVIGLLVDFAGYGNQLPFVSSLSLRLLRPGRLGYFVVFILLLTGLLAGARLLLPAQGDRRKAPARTPHPGGPPWATSQNLVSLGMIPLVAGVAWTAWHHPLVNLIVHTHSGLIWEPTFIAWGLFLCWLFVLFEMSYSRGDNLRALCLLLGILILLTMFFVLMLDESNFYSNWLPGFPPFASDKAQLGLRHSALGLLGVLLSWVVTLGWTADPNAISLHLFYRARLVRAYLGASNCRRSAMRQYISQPVADDDLLMKDLQNCRRGGPYHIINTTLNLVGGSDLATTQRSAAVFTMTKHYCGSSRTGYRDTREYMRGRLTLGTTVAISGAAASPNMGSISPTSSQAMLLTLLNVRLGFWAPTPNKGYWQEAQARLWPFMMLREFLSQTNDLASHCYLTDGAHFDNTGLYSLVERGCRFILISDCGTDPKFQFHDVGEAIRRCRIDFGAEIDLKLHPLLPGKNGKSSRHFAVGTIKYSRRHMAALGYKAASEAASTEPRTGVIILFKPVLTGKEDADLLQYGREDGQGFPHQATTDQWYDEAQFESYRRLGQLTAHALMESLEEEDRQKDGQVKEINQRLKAGSPIPAAEASLLFNVARRIAERESQLKKKEIITVKDSDEESHSGE